MPLTTLPTACLSSLLDLAWPMSCASCDSAGTRLCDECLAQIVWLPEQAQLPDRTECFTSTRFEGPVAQLITAYKDKGRTDVRWLLHTLMTDAVRAAQSWLMEQDGTHELPISLVPVPSSRTARRERGRFPLRELARPLRSPQLRYEDLLTPARRVRDQSHLSQAERVRNLEGALRVRDPRRLLGEPVSAYIVVDDVVTSGATAMEAVRALRTYTSAPVAVAAIARTPRRSLNQQNAELIGEPVGVIEPAREGKTPRLSVP